MIQQLRIGTIKNLCRVVCTVMIFSRRMYLGVESILFRIFPSKISIFLAIEHKSYLAVHHCIRFRFSDNSKIGHSIVSFEVFTGIFMLILFLLWIGCYSGWGSLRLDFRLFLLQTKCVGVFVWIKLWIATTQIIKSVIIMGSFWS